VVRLWRRPASACKPYRIKPNQNIQFLRAAEAVGLAVADRFKSPSFSKYNVFQIRRMRFAHKSASQCHSISSIDMRFFLSSCSLILAVAIAFVSYRWISHNSGVGFLDIARATPLLFFASLGRF
jgi:hypothetical protein